MKKVLFICTSNKDRSPALEGYFKSVYPKNEYRSAGVNKYFTSRKETHYLTQEDIDWADLIVFAEEIHHRVANRDFECPHKLYEDAYILDLGTYTQGQVGEDYLLRAEFKLKGHLE